MTVVTPGGPCLTQTQIFRDEQLARFKEKSEAKAEAAQKNPYDVAGVSQKPGITPEAVSGVDSASASNQTQKSYGAPGGGQLVDISV